MGDWRRLAAILLYDFFHTQTSPAFKSVFYWRARSGIRPYDYTKIDDGFSSPDVITTISCLNLVQTSSTTDED